ncbi:hypothetical protein C0995_012652 [Termitomyces sp. Mi166|nr:hypothetical protein C0995_012652 [Termitomyces sp. Mi166\
MAMSKVVDEEEVEELQQPRTLQHCVTIKEEVYERLVPEKTATSRLAARHVPLVENWNDHINYQCICNYDLQIQGKLLIDDQGVVFEGCGGVTPVDDMRRQFVAKTEKDEHPNNHGHGRDNNNQDDRGRSQHDRDHGDDRKLPSCRPEEPVPREPIVPHSKCRTEESPHSIARAWSLPSPYNLHASMPGINEAVKLHMDHMHDHLNRLVDDSLGVRFKFSDGVKPCRAEGKHIQAYAGGHKFSQLEDWAMDMCYHLAVCCYGGDDIDQERIFVLHEFIDGEVWNWFCRHVLHTNRDKHDWTFKEVLIKLYNHFVNAATMQEAHEAF